MYRRYPDCKDYVITSDGRVFKRVNNTWKKCNICKRTHSSVKLHTKYVDYTTDIKYTDYEDDDKPEIAHRIGIHLLVAKTYPDYIPCNGELYVRHKDGDTSNNDISNLYWTNSKRISTRNIRFPIKCIDTGMVFKNLKEVKDFYIPLGYKDSYITCNFAKFITKNGRMFKQNFEILKGE